MIKFQYFGVFVNDEKREFRNPGICFEVLKHLLQYSVYLLSVSTSFLRKAWVIHSLNIHFPKLFYI